MHEHKMTRFAQDVCNAVAANAHSTTTVAPKGCVKEQRHLGAPVVVATVLATRANGATFNIRVTRKVEEGYIRFIVRENGILLNVSKCPLSLEYQQEYYDALDSAVEYSA